jgi:hypothetical protein
MKFREWLQIQEDNQRTGSKIGLYPPLYTLSQYPSAYYTPIAADYITYNDMEKKSPTVTNPPSNLAFTIVSPDSKGRLKRTTEYA